jgi:hypothetical protein
MPVKVWVGRFALVDGQPQEEGPLLRSFPRQRPDEEEDELYVLASPAETGNREYYAQLVDAIGRMYQQDTLSITGAVLRAVQAAHAQLRDWNSRTLREQQVAAGLSCLAVRGRTAYLAQQGPAVAYHVGGGRFRRVVPEDGSAEPLGAAERSEPFFSRFELSPGDLVLVVSPRIGEIADDELLRSILVRGGDDALVELFRLARDQQEFSLVLLACVVEPEAGEGRVVAPPFAEPFAPPPEEPPAASVEAPGPPEPGVLVAAAQPEGAPPERAPPAAAASEALVIEPPPGFGEPKVRLKGPEAGVRYTRPGGLLSLLPQVPPVAIGIALIFVIAGLLAWRVIPSVLEDNQEERFADRLEAAERALDAAEATEDPAQRRELLRVADSELQQAEGLRPNDVEVRDLRARVDAALRDLKAELVLPELELIVDVSGRIPGPISSRDLALGGGGAYFIDREQGRVIAISLLGPDPDPFPLIQGGDLVGAQITGPPQYMAWSEDTITLLVMDDARRLISIAPPEAGRLLTVRDADAWSSADGIAYDDGFLYVLDRAGDQVWRYAATEDGFDSEREAVLPTFDLDQVIEMAVGDAIYLLLGDGSIVRVQGGAVQPFSQAGIDRALSSPASLVPLPSLDMVLVADRGNSRIVVFSPDGTFRQQLVSPSFTDLRAIAADEANQLLYILVGGALYRTPLPPLP